MPLSKQAVVLCPRCRTSHVPSTDGQTNGTLAATCVHCGHFFKFRSVAPFRSSITMTINGKSYTVNADKYGPGSALNGFLRDERISVGTKHMCYQGGCGTCMVEAKLYEPISQARLSYAVNSCLAPLYACDGWEIRTVDYIGNLRAGLHPIQKQIANYNGSQCGYCTPGQVMNMFALTEMYGTGLTKQQVENSFDGVICRCTGYRPILAAFKDMAIPHSSCKEGTLGDIEDLKKNMCKKTGRQCSGTCGTTGSSPLDTHMVFADAQWFRPTSEDAITTILNDNKGKKIRFLFGNTSTGVYSDLGPGNFDVVIDLASFMEMYGISFDTDIIFGGGLSLSNLIDIFNRTRPDMPYLGECADLLSRVANLPIRNRATWAGNIVMKHVHPEFPSDVFIMLHVLKAKIWLGFMADSVDITDFMNADIDGKLITSFSFTDIGLDKEEVVKFYKVQPRAQNAHAYVSAGFRMKLDKTTFLVKAQPVLAFNGIGSKFVRATKTEAYLNGKMLGNATVLSTAFSTLKSEIVADASPVLSSVAYRTNLAVALFYKFALHVTGTQASLKYRSGATELYINRPISSGQQTYDTVKMEYPVTEPLKKLEADAQACGQAEYVDDMPAYPGQVEAAFVLSTVGKAKLGIIDPSAALKIPGVVQVITAKDITGVNNWQAPGLLPEEVLASSDILYCGQPVAIVLAESYGTALGAVYAVKVTYTDIQTPLIKMSDAIAAKSFFPKPCDDLVVGDPDQAIANSPKQLTGTIAMGTQYHFHMETQASLCIPNENGMNVYTTTQWLDGAQSAVSQVTGMAKSSISVQVKRLGGAYGAKILRNNWIAGACGLAANLSNRPVKLRLTLGDNMKMVGKRYPFQANYQVGFTEDGQLNGINATYYGDCGSSPNDNSFPNIQTWADNAYNCPNWKISCVAVKTNTAANTACRSPGSLPAIFIMESLMEHVAKSLNKDPTDIRLMNAYMQGQVDPLTKMPLENCLLKPLIANQMAETQYTTRKQQIDTFNQENRWKKKGISLVPLKFGIDWRGVHYGVQVSVYNGDGTVAICHGGVELGQGVNTKVAQVCAYELGISMDMIRVLPTNSLITANGITTGGSITSENCCAAAIQCCKTLNARMSPVKAKVSDPTWVKVVNECFAEGIDLSARHWRDPSQTTDFQYYSYGATIAEVEFDVLTGEHQLSRVDVMFDCGQSTNPALDVGQVEGAFVMGLGYWLTEQCRYDPQTGALVTDSTWEYKPPSSKDIPVDFRVNLVKKNPNPAGVLGAKASGEPPMCMSCSALFALKRAIESARRDANKDTFFALNGPATVEACQMATMTDPAMFVLA